MKEGGEDRGVRKTNRQTDLIHEFDVSLNVVRLLDQNVSLLFQHLTSFADETDRIVGPHLQIDSQSQVHVNDVHVLTDVVMEDTITSDKRSHGKDQTVLTQLLPYKSYSRCPSGPSARTCP